MPQPDTVWRNVNLATMDPALMGSDNPYGAVRQAALGVSAGRIAWLGPEKELRTEMAGAGRVIDGQGGWLTPGLVDCHTHLIYSGNRAAEFEMRLNGAGYAEIAAQGGGIVSTVKATRAAGEEELFSASAKRLSRLMAEGVTTVEIKSGYGLDLDTELALLATAARLGREYPVRVEPTYLGAHALPPEFQGRADEYIAFVCDQVLPQVKTQGLTRAVDAFCETIGFSLEQTERVFQAAQALSLPVKLHAEQLSDMGGAQLAAKYQALSADHLEYLSQAGVAALAASDTVAVLLPGAFYFLGESQLPPLAELRAAGVPLALATDSNPGSSPTTSPLLMLNMACALFKMTPAEALAGLTINGARALGLADRLGSLTPGKQADLALWDISEPAELAYRFGVNPLIKRVWQGRISD